MPSEITTKILLKKSGVADAVPTASDLDYGEVAINYADGVLYYKNTNDLVRPVVANIGAGTVTSVGISTGDTGLTVTASPITTSGIMTLGGTLKVEHGGTGASSLTGYIKGNGTNAFTASTTIPGSDVGGDITGKASGVTGTVLVENGGTSANSAGGARTNLGAAKSGENADITSMTACTSISLPLSTNTDGADLLLKAGDGSSSFGGFSGGNVTIQSGRDGAGGAGVGQDIIMQIGSANPSTGSNFIVRHNTNLERFRINKFGAWGIGGQNYGTDGQVLMSKGDGTVPVWSDVGVGTVSSVGFSTTLSGLTVSESPVTTSGTISLEGTLGATSGGTDQTTYTKGDILYASDDNTLSKLPIGDENSVLSVNSSGVPAWSSSIATVSSVGLSTGDTGLTVTVDDNETNPITTSGTFTLGGTLNIANGGTGGTTASTAINNLFNGVTSITVGTVAATPEAATTRFIGNSNASTPTPYSGSIVIEGGTNILSNGTGGSVVLKGGTASGGGAPTAGNVILQAGDSSSYPGYVSIQTQAATGQMTERLRIVGSGAWSVGSSGLDYGTDGQVLISKGSGSAPVWGSVSSVGGGSVSSVEVSGGTTGLTTSGGPITDSGTITLEGTLNVANGGTGATDAGGARTNLGAVNIAGDTMTGYLKLNADPTESLHAATKQYVDNLASGISIGVSARAGTSVPLTATYSNGTNGVGATLTGTTTLPIISNVTLEVGDRVLVKNQTDAKENGIYEVTAINPYVLTRADDFNTTANIKAGDAFFVGEGFLASTQWVMNTAGSINVGTSNIAFAQFGGPGTFNAGSGISIANAMITNTGVTKLTAGTNISVSPTAGTGDVTVAFSGTLSATNGGTSQSTYAKGDLLYASAANTLSKLPIGALNSFLQVNSSGVPVWSTTTGVVSSVGLSGGLTGLTVSVGSGETNPITSSGTFTLAGTLAVANGGTGSSTPAGARANLGAAVSGFNGDITGLDNLTYIGTRRAGLRGQSLLIKTADGDASYSGYHAGSITLQTGIGYDGSGSDIIMEIGSYYPRSGSNFIVRHGANAERFRINKNGAWGLSGENYGTDGQLLMSKGSGSAPVWTTVNALGTVSSVGLSGGSTGLTVAVGTGQTNPITSSGTFTLGGILKVENGGTGGTTASTAINNLFNSVTSITVGSASSTSAGATTTFIGASNVSGTNPYPGNIVIRGGTQPLSASVPAGSVTIAGGDTVWGTGGNVILQGGTASSSPGYVSIRTQSPPITNVATSGVTWVTPGTMTERLRIVGTGAWSVGSTGTDYGTDGQVLISKGPDSSPQWGTLSGVGTVTSVGVSGGTTGLTTTGGPITASGTITLAGTLAVANGGTGLTAVPGSSGQLLFNSSQSYSATSLMSYSGTTLTVGASNGTFTFAGANPANNNSAGSSIIIVGGQSGNTGSVGGDPGSVFVRGGPGAPASGAGGDVYLQGGSGVFRSGSVFISTGLTITERLRITPTGAWGLSGANYGTTGQVLTSNGTSAPPTWTTVSGGGAGGSVTSVDVSGGQTGLTTSGGPVTGTGTITLAGTLNIANGGTGGTTASTAINNLFNGVTSITVGTVAATPSAATTTFIGNSNVSTPTPYPGNIVIEGGTSILSGGVGGSVVLRGGTASGGGATTGGNVTLQGGRASSYLGYVSIQTVAGTGILTERLRIGGSGAWSVGSTGTDYGTAGQVLTSNGNGGPPTWTAVGGGPGGTIAITNGGTGATTASAAINNLFSGVTSVTVGSAGASATAATTGFYGASNVSGINPYPGNILIQGGTQSLTESAAAGSVTIAGGGNTGGGPNVGGNVNLHGGTAGSYPGYVAIRTQAATGQMTERLRIVGTGAWSVGSTGTDYGTAGHVLTSNGNAPPTWSPLSSTSTLTTKGDLLTHDGTNSVRLPVDANNGYILVTDSTTTSGLKWAPPSAVAAASASTLTGTTLASNVVSSSLTSVGTLSSLNVSGATTLSNALIFGTFYTETRVSVTAAASTAINCSLGNIFNVTMSNNITLLSFNNVPAAGRVYTMTLILNQDSTGARTLSWPTSIRWSGGVVPALTATANKIDIFTIFTHDGGTTWFGFIAGTNF